MKSGMLILGSAAILGLLSDFLFFDTVYKTQAWGLNLFVWLALFSAFIAGFLRHSQRPKSGQWFVLLALNFAAIACWRDSATLRALDVLSISLCLGIACYVTQGFDVTKTGLIELAIVNLNWLICMLIAPVELLLKHVPWNGMINPHSRRIIAGLLRGMLIALPLVLLFAGLFAAADAAFNALVFKSVSLNWGDLSQHSLLVAMVSWTVMAFFFMMMCKEWNVDASGAAKSLRVQLGTIELATIMGSLNLVFLAFVLVQLRYFFGGSELVKLTAGLSYAEYARQGFFELVWVAALVLPLLLLLDHFACGENAPNQRKIMFKILAGTQLCLLSVVIVSAVQRMLLYQSQYGMTELRLYTTAFMGWIVFLSIAFAVTVLRSRRQHFAMSALSSAFAVVVALHVLNPDAMIVSMNVARAKAGHNFDATYALSLSRDAVPVLVENLDVLPKTARQQLAANLLAVEDLPQINDWRSWNWSRHRARSVVHHKRLALSNVADLYIHSASSSIRHCSHGKGKAIGERNGHTHDKLLETADKSADSFVSWSRN